MKHVFRKSSWGTLSHEGEFVKETDKTVTYRRNTHERRMDKSSAIIFETNDPSKIMDAYKREWLGFEPDVNEARGKLRSVETAQREAAMNAARQAAS